MPDVINKDAGWVLYEWAALSEAGTADELDLSGFRDFIADVEVTANTAGGMTVSLTGSHVSGQVGASLTDGAGNAISFTASGAAQLSRSPLFIIPQVSGGTGADWDVRLLVRYA
jgi:hypothetical protein